MLSAYHKTLDKPVGSRWGSPLHCWVTLRACWVTLRARWWCIALHVSWVCGGCFRSGKNSKGRRLSTSGLQTVTQHDSRGDGGYSSFRHASASGYHGHSRNDSHGDGPSAWLFTFSFPCRAVICLVRFGRIGVRVGDELTRPCRHARPIPLTRL